MKRCKHTFSFLREYLDPVPVALLYAFIDVSRLNQQNQQNEYAPNEDSDQPGHPSSLIRVFAGRSMVSSGPKLPSCGQRRLWSDWADAQVDLRLRWALKPFCWFCHEAAHVILLQSWQFKTWLQLHRVWFTLRLVLESAGYSFPYANATIRVTFANRHLNFVNYECRDYFQAKMLINSMYYWPDVMWIKQDKIPDTTK